MYTELCKLHSCVALVNTAPSPPTGSSDTKNTFLYCFLFICILFSEWHLYYSVHSIYQHITIPYCGDYVPGMCGRHTGGCRETGHLKCYYSCSCHSSSFVSSYPAHQHCSGAVGGAAEQTAWQRERYNVREQ